MTVPTPPWEKTDREPKRPAKVLLTRDRIDAAYVVLDREGYHRLSVALGRRRTRRRGLGALRPRAEQGRAVQAHVRARCSSARACPSPTRPTGSSRSYDFARVGRAKAARPPRPGVDLDEARAVHARADAQRRAADGDPALRRPARPGGRHRGRSAVDLPGEGSPWRRPPGSSASRPPRPRSGPRSWSSWRATSATCRRRTTRT